VASSRPRDTALACSQRRKPVVGMEGMVEVLVLQEKKAVALVE
jgi:hypothetical protein